jgi:mono/diheme cytochrome c family protein
MSTRSSLFAFLSITVCFAGAGCRYAPGKPQPNSAAIRPEQVLDFHVLYKQNCSACHGVEGRNGAAISLANPIYLMTAGVGTLEQITAMGIPGTLMPAFDRKAGGTLTEAQVAVLSNGMVEAWGNQASLVGVIPLPYASHTTGNTDRGRIAFVASCASCHGASGEGISNKSHRTGSVVDPTYLDLVSDQSLRSLIIAGRPDLGMPDWRSDLTGPDARPITDEEIADIVAWMRARATNKPSQSFTKQP